MAHISPIATREELIVMIENREALISDLKECIEKDRAIIKELSVMLPPAVAETDANESAGLIETGPVTEKEYAILSDYVLVSRRTMDTAIRRLKENTAPKDQIALLLEVALSNPIPDPVGRPDAWRVDSDKRLKGEVYFYYPPNGCEFVELHRKQGDKITPLYAAPMQGVGVSEDENGESSGYADWIRALSEEFDWCDDLNGPMEFIEKLKAQNATTEAEIIERCAKVAEGFKNLTDRSIPSNIASAIRALANVSTDMVLVPREPTEEMIAAFKHEAINGGGGAGNSGWINCYRKMLAASPSPRREDGSTSR